MQKYRGVGMGFLPYNSRDKFFKDKFGSIVTNEKIHFRICMPRSFCCQSAFLMIRRDDGDFVEQKMYWAGMCGDDAEMWDIYTHIEKEGLYWYHFDYISSYGRGSILESHDGLGIFSGGFGTKKDWQLTVSKAGVTTPDWIKGGIIYQIFPDRFYNSKKPKKNVPTDRVLRDDWGNCPVWEPNSEGKVLNNDFFGGDLEGIRTKLPYLKSLGVTCIYLNPIFESHSNHRYDTADYSKIDPLLGDEEDFKNLCDTAKNMGIQVHRHRYENLGVHEKTFRSALANF